MNTRHSVKSFLIVINSDPDYFDFSKLDLANLFAGENAQYYSSLDKYIQVIYMLREGASYNEDSSTANTNLRLLLGDNSEYREHNLNGSYAACALIDVGLSSPRTLSIYTSIVGLPAIYLYKSKGVLILTSDLYLLATLPISIGIDAQGLLENLIVGHPIGNRTLLSNAHMLGAGLHISVNEHGVLKSDEAWIFPPLDPMGSIEEYVQLQSESLNSALDLIDVSDSFLSLTAGLDTRAIFAGLLRRGVNLPTCTITSENLSLDAQTAARLSNHYGFSHNLIYLDKEFYEKLPEYITRASLLSGGLHSIGQAHEVYYYTKTKHLGTARISGNLGNQICRLGVERITMRNSTYNFLNPEILSMIDHQNIGKSHWYHGEVGDRGGIDVRFLLQREVPYTSVGNYSIGNYFATQQTPYANRKLISNLKYAPTWGFSGDTLSPAMIRIRDIKHRFLGQSKTSSFQIHVINMIGGYVANYPINWGWTASGGVSMHGLFRGVLAFLDAIATAKNLDGNLSGKILGTLKIAGKHEYVRPKLWLTHYLREFVHDTIQSKNVKESGLFDNSIVEKTLIGFYQKNNVGYREVAAILDTALLVSIFVNKQSGFSKVSS